MSKNKKLQNIFTIHKHLLKNLQLILKTLIPTKKPTKIKIFEMKLIIIKIITMINIKKNMEIDP